jgi:DNA-binding CsgD family transcriptional regulator
MQICDPAADARTLRLRLLDEIREAIGFDAYAWLLTDPQTSVGSAPLADVPCLPELPRLIRLKYLTDINRWTTLRSPPVALLREVTAGDLSRSLLWRDLLAGYDIADVASRVALFARAFALSARESELVGQLVTGADTRELARQMFLSEHTVQDHLKSIFAKTSTHNRRALLSLVLGA